MLIACNLDQGQPSFPATRSCLLFLEKIGVKHRIDIRRPPYSIVMDKIPAAAHSVRCAGRLPPRASLSNRSARNALTAVGSWPSPYDIPRNLLHEFVFTADTWRTCHQNSKRRRDLFPIFVAGSWSPKPIANLYCHELSQSFRVILCGSQTVYNAQQGKNDFLDGWESKQPWARQVMFSPLMNTAASSIFGIPKFI